MELSRTLLVIASATALVSVGWAGAGASHIDGVSTDGADLDALGPDAEATNETTVTMQILEQAFLRDAIVQDSDLHWAALFDSAVSGSEVSTAVLHNTLVESSYLDRVLTSGALIEDSRVDRAILRDTTVRDATVCNTTLNHQVRVGTCQLVSNEGGTVTSWARLTNDAPATVAPGQTYELQVRDANATNLTVRNDPAGMVGLGFETANDPLGLQQTGFVAAADNDTVADLQLIDNGTVVETFQLGDTLELPGGNFTLRVNVSETGVVDGARLGLALDLDDHTLRPAVTSVEVVATQLAFAPMEAQAFAPFVADDVARLVLSVPTDEAGNVDRDLDIATQVNVTDVASGDVELVGEEDDHAALHDDSRLFSEEPFGYSQSVEAAHHPTTLELLVRDNLQPNLTYGALNVYGTHVVAISPWATNVTITAETVNADGENLTATIDLALNETPEQAREVNLFGQAFELPGRGTLQVNLLDENGTAVEAQDDWSLSIHETPDSHGVRQVIDLDEGQTTVEQDLAGSVLVGTPLGNFVESQYRVCLHHGQQQDCANGGNLTTIETGQTTEVDIVVG